MGLARKCCIHNGLFHASGRGALPLYRQFDDISWTVNRLDNEPWDVALFFVGALPVFFYNFFRCIFGLLKWNSPVGKSCHSPQLRNKSLNLFIPRPLDERQVCAWIRLKARVDLVFGQRLAARSDDRRRQFLARSQRCGKDVIRGEGRTVRYLRFFEQFFFWAKAAETSSKSSNVWLLPKLYWFRWNIFFSFIFWA